MKWQEIGKDFQRKIESSGTLNYCNRVLINRARPVSISSHVAEIPTKLALYELWNTGTFTCIFIISRAVALQFN